MSFDLAFWREDPVPSPADAAVTYDRLAEGEEGVVAPDGAVGRFLADVVAAYPDLVEDNMDISPWASPIYSNAECVLVAISWSRAAELAPALRQIATRHGLLTYDPQEQQVLV